VPRAAPSRLQAPGSLSGGQASTERPYPDQNAPIVLIWGIWLVPARIVALGFIDPTAPLGPSLPVASPAHRRFLQSNGNRQPSRLESFAAVSGLRSQPGGLTMRWFLALSLVLVLAASSQAEITAYHYGAYGQPLGTSVYYGTGSQMRIHGAVSTRGWRPRYLYRYRAPVYYGGWAVGGTDW
jgi:hypothetical protein